MKRRLVPQFPKRLADLVFDFFLVEGTAERRLVGGRCVALFGLLPPVVEYENVQFAHCVTRL